MQHALLHSGPTTASQTYNEHSEIRAVHHLSPHATPYVKSPQHDKSIPTASSSDIYRHPAEASDTELTPPTSSSRLSSQESIASGGQDSSLAAKSVNSNALHAVTLARPVEIESPSGCPIKNITAPKRTSGGEIKRVNVSTADFLKSSHGKSPGHSRTSSSLSNGTNVAELSQQLRTRLSYAMLKVQNGWESHTLEQIAGLTSQQGSPRASVTAASPVSNRQPLHSSNSAMTSNLQRDRNADVSLDGVSAAGGATFDILDRAQRETNHHQRIGSGSHRRALAPPADIVPNSQRQHPHHANPLLNGYRSVNSVRPTASKQRTPSQNAAMEADAVETLLFMASPGNSGHHPSSGRPSSSAQISAPTSSSQPSPLTSEFPNRELLPTSSPHRRVVSSTAANRPETIELPSSRMHDDIDRMIDDMDDDSSPDTDVRFWI